MNENTQPSLLDPLEQKIVTYIIRSPEISKSKLAEEVNIDRRTLDKILDKESVRLAIQFYTRTAEKILFDGLADAARVLIDCLKSDKAPVRLNAAKTILEGMGALRVYVENNHKITPDLKAKLEGYAKTMGISLEEYCGRHGISISELNAQS